MANRKVENQGRAHRFLHGKREYYVVSHSGRSQYSSGDISFCELAALNCARLVLQRSQETSLNGTGLLKTLMLQETCESILSICLRWSNSAHLEVEEIINTPVFRESLDLMWTDYDQPGLEQFRMLLSRLEYSIPTSAALIVTRAPETICILKIVAEGREKPVYVSFDSHPRVQHPNGPAFVFHRSLTSAAHYLSEIMKYNPGALDTGSPSLHWQARLLAPYSAHALTAKPKSALAVDSEHVLVEASLEVLRLKAEISELRETNRMLESEVKVVREENGSLDKSTKGLQDAYSVLQREVDSLKSRLASLSRGIVADSEDMHFRSLTPMIQPGGQQPQDAEVSNTTRAAYPSPTPFPLASCGRCGSKPDDHEGYGGAMNQESSAMQAVLDWQSEIGYYKEEHGASAVAGVQQQSEDENILLHEQMESLIDMTPATFDCAICMESVVEDMVARVFLCGHEFCRPCLLQHVQTKLVERRFPIGCPSCSVQLNDGTQEPAVISGEMALDLGLNEVDFATLTELEMASFAVQLNCRMCKGSAYIDKGEYETLKIITCPIPECPHIWCQCKECSQSVDPQGPQHSCDGTSELNHLMVQQGWKNCPGCRTPTSKSEGCNFMTCITPGCNMHFCYVCSNAIIRSINAQSIQNAKVAHYAGCQIV